MIINYLNDNHSRNTYNLRSTYHKPDPVLGLISLSGWILTCNSAEGAASASALQFRNLHSVLTINFKVLVCTVTVWEKQIKVYLFLAYLGYYTHFRVLFLILNFQFDCIHFPRNWCKRIPWPPNILISLFFKCNTKCWTFGYYLLSLHQAHCTPILTAQLLI